MPELFTNQLLAILCESGGRKPSGSVMPQTSTQPETTPLLFRRVRVSVNVLGWEFAGVVSTQKRSKNPHKRSLVATLDSAGASMNEREESMNEIHAHPGQQGSDSISTFDLYR
jgi:hypothetical protein